MNLKQNNRGTTLVELMAVISVMGALAFMAGVGIVIFFAKWTELNLFADLQTDAFNTIMTLKQGVIVSQGDSEEYMGIAAADSVQFLNQSGGVNNYTGIRCMHPMDIGEHTDDYIEFWWDAWEGCIKTTHKYAGRKKSTPDILFPDEHKDEIRVTKLSFQKAGSDKVVRIILEAKIDIGDDKVRKVRYETRVALGIT